MPKFGFNLAEYIPWFGRLPVAPVTTLPIRAIINANNQKAVFPLDGVNAWGMDLTGTWVGTLGFQISYNGGKTFTTGFGYDLGNNQIGVASVTGNTAFRSMLSGGGTHLMVQSTAWTSGTAVLDFSGTQCGVDIPFGFVEGDTKHDDPDSGYPLKIGGKALTGTIATAVGNLDRVNAHWDVYGRLVTRPSNTFSINHVPAANAQATIAQAAAGVGIKNVCTSISITVTQGATTPAAQTVQFNLRDGASGAGTILQSWKLACTAVVGDCNVLPLPGLWIEGTANTAMTLETSAATTANVAATVAMTGTITQ